MPDGVYFMRDLFRIRLFRVGNVDKGKPPHVVGYVGKYKNDKTHPANAADG